MNRRDMILTLASAALIPSARLLAKPGLHFPDHSACDRKLAEIISNLEHTAWETFKTYDLQTWKKVYADGFFEILEDGSFWTREDLIADIESHVWQTDYTMSDIAVIQTSETSALLRYVINVDYVYNGVETFNTYAQALSSYAKIRGRWQGTSYQETSLDGTP